MEKHAVVSVSTLRATTTGVNTSKMTGKEHGKYNALGGSSSTLEDDSDASLTSHGENDEDSEVTDGAEEEQVSTLECARYYGLCEDYLKQDPMKLCASMPLPISGNEDLQDPADLVSVEKVSVDELTRERVEVPVESLLFLQKSLKVDDQYDTFSALPIRPPKRNARVELPLLATDNEMDVLNFGRVPEPDFQSAHYPAEHVDVEKDEGIEWPSKYADLSERKWKEIERDKIEVPMEAVRYLQDMVKDPATKDDLDALYSSIPSIYERKNKFEPVTPPMLPMLSPPLTPFDPSSPTAQLPLLSQISGSLDAEIEALDARIQQGDRVGMENVDLTDDFSIASTDDFVKIYTPLQSAVQSDAISSPLKRKRDDLKVDVPMIGDETASSSPSKRSKSVSFAERLHEIIPDLPSPRPTAEVDPDSEASFVAFFKDVVEPAGREATQALEQEKLQDADSLQRVEVPVMDFSVVTPPWEVLSRAQSGKLITSELESQRRLLPEILESQLHLSEYGPWSKPRGKYQWIPFPVELGKVPDERIDDLRYMAVIMNDMSLQDVVTSDQLVWKPEGLRIMHADDYEDEEMEVEELGAEHEESDFDGLVRKRRRELEQELPTERIPSRPPSEQLPVRSRDGDKPKAAITLPHFPVVQNTTTPLMGPGSFGGVFSTKLAISTFMTSMGQQNKKLRLEEPKPAEKICAKTISTFTAQPEPALPPPEIQQTIEPYPLPIIPPNPEPRYFILSSTLHQTSRPLLRAITTLYPSAHLIDRDFTSILAAPEADLLLSPMTGLVLTTLQKIKQKALPSEHGGGGQLTKIRERLFKLAPRYERLVVLVGDAFAPEIGLDEGSCASMAEFAAFCVALKTEIQVVYVPAGDEAMARWVVDFMLTYATTIVGFELLQDETMWEQLLRRAGLNAFAAQVVLANLGAGDAALGGDFGIRAFVRMLPEERVRRFEGLLGGRRVLQRVNRALEMEWLSAVNGFKGVRG